MATPRKYLCRLLVAGDLWHFTVLWLDVLASTGLEHCAIDGEGVACVCVLRMPRSCHSLVYICQLALVQLNVPSAERAYL